MNRVKLGDIAVLKTGPFGTQLSAKEYTENGIPIINVKNIGYGDILTDELDYVSEDTCERLNEHILEEGDIVFGRKGSVDRHAYIDKQFSGWLQGSDCIRVRCIDDVNKKYISHYLKLEHIKKQVNHAAVGSTMASLNTDILKRIEIDLPDRMYQDAIENILTLIEEKIVLNKKINDNLLQQLQLIYNYWFTQFDFPSKENHPYNASGGDMVRNEQVKRNIPANWEVKSLGELCLFRNGINYDKSIEGEKTYKIINVRNISSTDIMLNENELDEIRLPQKQGDKYCVSAESIIIARSGIPGATRILYKPSNNTIFCGFVISCTPIDSDMQYYLTFYLKQLEGSSATKTGGSILQNVSQDTLSNLIVPIPPREILGKFNQIVSQTFELLHENLKETSRLVKLRDWLLPLLMNGQATIDD